MQQEESLQLAENSSSAALDGARLEGSSSGHAVAGMPTAEGQAAKVGPRSSLTLCWLLATVVA